MAPEHTAPAPAQLTLPLLVFGAVEVRRLHRELEALEEYLRQAEIRQPGQQAPLPRVSRLLDALATDNNLQLLQAAHRQQLKQFLELVQAQAPSVHISFAIDPSASFTAKLVSWLRTGVHPYALLEVGLQPTIAAGCVVRTPNKVFDFSLRERFADASGLLMQALEAATGGSTATTPASAAAVADTTAVPMAEAPATGVAASTPVVAPSPGVAA